MSKKIVQTAGRNQLGEIAPMFAHLNDDVLFGEVWNEEAIDVKTKCIITVVSLMASGITDSSLAYHLQNAKNHGVSQKEIAAIMLLNFKSLCFTLALRFSRLILQNYLPRSDFEAAFF